MAETYSAGIVTAYGAAVRGGYTGTYEQFCAEQAQFGANAAKVAQDRAAVEAATQTFTTVTVPGAVQAVQQTGATQVQAVEAASETEQQQIALAGAAQETRVTQAGDDQVDAVEEAGATQVGNVNTAGTTQVGNVNTAGTTQVGAVNTAGATQVQAVEDKGQEVIDSIPDDYTELTEDVSSLKSALNEVAVESPNIFDNTVATQVGYHSPSGKLNAETLVPALDSVASSAYTLIMKAIPVTAGKTYAFPSNFVGRLSTYSSTITTVDGVPYYNRVSYVPNTSMISGNNCLLWTVPSGIIYVAMHIWKSDGVPQSYIDSFMILEVENVSTFVYPDAFIPHGYKVVASVPVNTIKDYNIVGKDTEIQELAQSKAGTKIFNLYDNTVALANGYTISTTADIANMTPTLVANSAFNASTKLIAVQGGETVAVSREFHGQIGVYNSSGGRSTAKSDTDMTVGNNCLYFEIPSSYSTYYLGIAFSTRYDPTEFVLSYGTESLSHEFVNHSSVFLTGAKVSADDVVGFADYVKNPDSKFTFAMDTFIESYAARVQQYQGANALTITFKTDSHTDMNLDTIHTIDSITNALETGYVGDYLGQDLIVHGGDLLTTGYTSKTEPIHSLRGYLNRMFKFAKAPFLVAKGNHDDNCYDSLTTTNNKSTDILILPDEWNAIAMQYAKKFAVCPIDGRANYCYIDNERTKIRVFVLDTEDFDYHVTNGVAELNSGGVCAFSNAQLNFVADALKFGDKDAPSEWAALFISHRPMDTTTTSGKRMGIGDRLIVNHDIMLNIIKAYKNGTSYSASGYGGKDATEIATHYYPYDVNVDYTSNGQGEVIAMLFGHTHECNTSDEVGANSSALSYGYRYISCGSTSFYTLVFNRNTKKINVLFYDSIKANVQLPNSSASSHAIIGLTASDLNNYGDWETSWT